ncbi:hypothetical protein CDL60_14075 [Roseateles noduli]|nr:hypothetical protein CDL60_14075 [Roseateles noduli]
MTIPNVDSGTRILVVDDNVDAADTLVILLQSLGFNATATYDGHEAVLLVELLRPQLILLDLNMPGMDGFETAASIRGTELGDRSYLVALTGSEADLDPVLASCLGFDVFVTKPVGSRQLTALARAALRQSGRGSPPQHIH